MFISNKTISKTELAEAILKEIQEKFNLTTEELKEILITKEEKESFPVQILRTKELSSLESIVKYLRENKKASYKEIGFLLNRNPASLASTYKVAKTKKPKHFSEETISDPQRIPFSIFQNKLSILEAIATHFRNSGLKFSEIGLLLGKDQKTIWTVCNRAKKKLGGVTNE